MRIASLVLFLIGLALPARAGDFPDKGDPAEATRRTLATADGPRDYLVQPLPGRGPRPVVILLHGGTQEARQIWKQTSLATIARREGFILVAPNGLDRHWNDGRGATIAAGPPSTADDIGFLLAVIDDVARRDGGDPRTVFMAGVSNGGFMAMAFACSGRFQLKAGANLISNLPAAAVGACKAAPTPWLSLNGTSDSVIPFAGQPAGTVRRGEEQPALLSADETFLFFAARAGCARETLRDRLPDLDPGDGSWVERKTHPCPGARSAVQYIVHNGGHVTPGLALGPVLGRMLGGVNMDVDTGSLLWSFFGDQRR
ncbi:alpha/beta hydrolase family esterase [Zavarzinia compransoris]|uniref:Polyhydroxybutyrate depolymerase n=1 Tax=Zavarzinia compransoris TaxID=1264899 RepID=A0A317E186_9PROT|nr:PHB depolymerase family esterase [Zavarzinia compransoris]PWR19123.1 hypothetical protein DKG75_19395 [Zavarzinia compransoris]TDP49134.1 polyhydroxybutyrate depolymerase [Zavarzinia compransoris]